jgi:Zn-dependent protease
MDNIYHTLQIIFIWAIPVLFAVTLHEVAHGWVASKFGDKTALMLGRLTLNPIKHIDLIGTILVPMIFLLLGGFIFGWAKPVPVDWRNLKNPRRDMALVALAGPGANLLMAIFWAIIAKIFLELTHQGFAYASIFTYMGVAGISINLMLMILNLIPIPPLDGSRVVASLLEKRLAIKYEALEPYGFIILILLIMSGVLSMILQEPYHLIQQMIHFLFGL